jgi:hypothetical protein
MLNVVWPDMGKGCVLMLLGCEHGVSGCDDKTYVLQATNCIVVYYSVY